MCLPAWSPRNPRISVEILWRLLTQAWSLINSISSPSPLEDWGWGGKFQASNPGLGFPVTTPHLGATQGHLCGTEEALGDLLFCFCVCVCVFFGAGTRERTTLVILSLGNLQGFGALCQKQGQTPVYIFC